MFYFFIFIILGLTKLLIKICKTNILQTGKLNRTSKITEIYVFPEVYIIQDDKRRLKFRYIIKKNTNFQSESLSKAVLLFSLAIKSLFSYRTFFVFYLCVGPDGE